jgi:F-type H+-transporting ATPase subunit delta
MRQFAKALHHIALEKNKLDVLSYQFDELRDLIKEHPTWLKMVDSPMLSNKEKEAKIDELGFDPTFLAFIKVLSSKHYMQYIDEIYDEWIHLVRTTQKIAHLHVYLAKPMTKIQEEKLMQALKPRFKNQTISLHKTIDPSLIGGIKITHQGQALDRSVARELEELFTTI